jgi:hypothetical protein
MLRSVITRLCLIAFLTVPLIVLPASSASAACSTRPSIEKRGAGSIAARAEFSGCTIEEGDKVCLQRKVDGKWSSIACRSGYEFGSRSAETRQSGCAYPTDENYYRGTYRAYTIIGGRVKSSAVFNCPGDR